MKSNGFNDRGKKKNTFVFDGARQVKMNIVLVSQLDSLDETLLLLACFIITTSTTLKAYVFVASIVSLKTADLCSIGIASFDMVSFTSTLQVIHHLHKQSIIISVVLVFFFFSHYFDNCNLTINIFNATKQYRLHGVFEHLGIFWIRIPMFWGIF